jgi:hypothetical protein
MTLADTVQRVLAQHPGVTVRKLPQRSPTRPERSHNIAGASVDWWGEAALEIGRMLRDNDKPRRGTRRGSTVALGEVQAARLKRNWSRM